MKRLRILFFSIAILVSSTCWLFAEAEKGVQPQLKIVIGNDKSIQVYDMQGNMITDNPESIQPATDQPKNLNTLTFYSKSAAELTKTNETNVLAASQATNPDLNSFAFTPDQSSDHEQMILQNESFNYQAMQHNENIQFTEQQGAGINRVEDASATPDLGFYTGSGSVNDYNYNASTHYLTVYVSVANGGDGNAGAFRVGYYLSTNTTISPASDILIQYTSLSYLNSMYYSNISGSVDLDDVSGLASGTYYVAAYADYLYQISESSETNNGLYFTPTISYTSTPPPPSINLTSYTGTGAVNSCTYSSSTHIITANSSVQNNGTQNAGAFRIGYYLSTNTTINTSDFLIGYESRSSLNAGAYYNSTITKNLWDFTSDQLPSGTYYAGVFFDYQNSVAESNENDNTGYYSPSFSYTAPPPSQPNLTDYNGTGAVNTVDYNTTSHRLELSFSVQNNGSSAAGAFRVGWYLSTDTGINSDTDLLLDTFSATGLTNGYFLIATASKDLDGFCSANPVAPGDYYIGVIIDDQEKINESDENDNKFYFNDTIHYIGCGINLKIYTGTGANNTFTYNPTTHLLSFNASIENEGSEDAGAFRIGWYLSENTTIQPEDHFIAYSSVASLPAGNNTTKSLSKDLDDFCDTADAIPAGSYYAALIIDYQYTVAEGDENDNTYYWSSPMVDFGGCTTTTFTINGALNYYMGNVGAIENVQLNLSGDTPATVSSDAAGNFVFNNVTAGNCSLSASKERSIAKDASITAFDASYVMRNYVGSLALTESQKISADASGNGQITAFDASIILRYYVGQDVTTYDIAKWKFVVPPVANWTTPTTMRKYSPLNSNQVNQNFDGILVGDVTGNWSASALEKAGEGVIAPGEIKPLADNLLQVPIKIAGVSSYYAIGLDLEIDPGQLQLEKITQTRENENTILAFYNEKGVIRIALASAVELKETDLLNITFKKVGKDELRDIKITLQSYEIDTKRVDTAQQWNVAIEKTPTQFDLKQNYPNPFNPSTTIVYSVPQKSTIKLTIFNTLGQKIRELINTSQNPGEFELEWNGLDDYGKDTPSGIYIVQLTAGHYNKTIKITKTK